MSNIQKNVKSDPLQTYTIKNELFKQFKPKNDFVSYGRLLTHIEFKHKDQIQLSASDLSNFLSCHHITELDKKVLDGVLKKPEFINPHAQVLRERGHEHEKNYLDYLKNHFS